MTNTRITDAEVLESRYPILLNEFSIRTGSGGDGAFVGGDGVVRDFTFFDALDISLVTERRVFAPNGIMGGCNGSRGYNTMTTPDKDGVKGKTVNLGGKASLTIEKGTRVRILTPGGGGYGHVGDKSLAVESEKPKGPVFEGIGSYNRSLKIQEQG